MLRRLARVFVLVCLAVVMTGCKSSGMRSFDLMVQPDQSLSGTVEVAFVGVNENNSSMLQSSLEEGFFGTRFHRQNAHLIHEAALDTTRSEPQRLMDRKDEMWTAWKSGGVQMLYVVTSTARGTFSNYLETLDKSRFKSSVKSIAIRVAPDAVYIDTVPDPPAE